MVAKLSTHVLNIANGCPAAGMQVELWTLDEQPPRRMKVVRTNADGRTDQPLLLDDEMKPGQYELVFLVGDYFAQKFGSQTQIRFLDRVPIRFGIAEPAAYHVPLLVSPWAYSTYRGS